MKKSSAIGASAMIAVGFAAIIGFRLLDQPGENSISVNEPTQCRIGELVTLDAASSDFDSIVWTIDPETLNFKIINEGRQAIFSSEVPGEFVVTVATSKDNAVALAIVKLQVAGSLEIRGDIHLGPGGVQGNIRGVLPFGPAQLPIPFGLKPKNDSIEAVVVPNPFGENVKTFKFVPKPKLEPIDVSNWLPTNQTRLGKVIKNLQTVDGLIDADRFESEDEITQAALWSVKRATNNSNTWKPFIVNYSNYLEKATSKQDCALRTKHVLQSLKNATT